MISHHSQAAFASRIKSFFAWQNAESEARRSKVQYERERGKKGGKYAPDENNDSVIPDIAQVNQCPLNIYLHASLLITISFGC
jgi:hypothetical protein